MQLFYNAEATQLVLRGALYQMSTFQNCRPCLIVFLHRLENVENCLYDEQCSYKSSVWRVKGVKQWKFEARHVFFWMLRTKFEAFVRICKEARTQAGILYITVAVTVELSVHHRAWDLATVGLIMIWIEECSFREGWGNFEVESIHICYMQAVDTYKQRPEN